MELNSKACTHSEALCLQAFRVQSLGSANHSIAAPFSSIGPGHHGEYGIADRNTTTPVYHTMVIQTSLSRCLAHVKAVLP